MRCEKCNTPINEDGTPVPVTIGKYQLSNYQYDGIWIQNVEGEGMQVHDPDSIENLEQLIDEFWDETF